MASAKQERLKALLAGEAVHPPVASFFGHKHDEEQNPRTLVAHLLRYNRQNDWDFIKVQSRATYYGEAWGCPHEYDSKTGPVMVGHIVHQTGDYYQLQPVDVTQGVFDEHVQVARGLAAELKGSVPHVHTVFSPLTILNRLGGAQRRTEGETSRLVHEMETAPDAVRHGLEVVTRSLEDYVRQLIRAGGDGIFITTTAWDADHLDAPAYRLWAEPYERRLYEVARAEGAWLNIIHACRAHTHFDIVKDYPVEIISYDALSGRNPGLADALQRTDKVLWSGISVDALQRNDREQLVREIEEAGRVSGWRRLALGPTCAVPPTSDPDLLSFIKARISGS